MNRTATITNERVYARRKVGGGTASASDRVDIRPVPLERGVREVRKQTALTTSNFLSERSVRWHAGVAGMLVGDYLSVARLVAHANDTHHRSPFYNGNGALLLQRGCAEALLQ